MCIFIKTFITANSPCFATRYIVPFRILRFNMKELDSNINLLPSDKVYTDTRLAEAINEFITTGKANCLNKYVVGKNASSPLYDLLRALCVFSDAIYSFNHKYLAEAISKLKVAVCNCQSLSNDTVENALIKQVFSTVSVKLFGNQGNIDILSVVQWCADISLIQQAVAIYESETPALIFEEGLIEFASNQKQAKCEKAILHCNHEIYKRYSNAYEYAFNTDILTYTKDKMQYSILQRCLSQKNECPKDPVLEHIIKEIKCFDNAELKYTGEHPTSQLVKSIEGYIQSTKPAKYKFLTRWLRLNGKIIKEAIGYRKQYGNLYQVHFEAIDNICQNGMHPDYILHTSVDDFAKMAYAYLYMKYMLHQLHHTDEENLTTQQWSILEKYGYQNADSLEATIHNIQIAVRAVQNATYVYEESILVSGDTLSSIRANKQLCVKFVDKPEYKNLTKTYSKGQMVNAEIVKGDKVTIPGVLYYVPVSILGNVNCKMKKGSRICVTIQEVSSEGSVLSVTYDPNAIIEQESPNS